MTKHKFLSILLITTITVAALFLMRENGPMPLEVATTEEFQTANSRAMEKLMHEKKGLSLPVQSAVAFRHAVHELGYDPEKTLLCWLSPEFKEGLQQVAPANRVNDMRLSERLIQTALGDFTSNAEFQKIISSFGPELKEAARQRRNL